MIKKVSFIVYKIKDGKPLYFVGVRPESKIKQYPTAKCEVDENHIECAFRELEEELGEVRVLNFTDLNYSFKFKTEAGDYHENVVAFEIDDVQKLQKEEFSKYEFLPFREAIRNLSFESHKQNLKNINKLLSEGRVTKFVIIVAPTACGKSVIIKDLLNKYPHKFERVKTYMTREFKREEDSLLRIHVSKKEFENLDKKGLLIEKNFHDGNWYGSSYELIKEAYKTGKNLIAEVDINGAKRLSAIFSNVVTIFISAPLDEIEYRLRQRGGHSEEEIARRLATAKREISQKELCDKLVVNKQGKYEETFGKIEAILDKILT